MKFYLAARYIRRRQMLEIASELQALGHSVVSTWIDGHHETRPGIDGDATVAEKALWAIEDVHDIERCDCLLAFTEEPRSGNSRGGRHVELGIALGLGKQVIICGPRENVFCCLPEVEAYDSWVECKRAIGPA